MPNNTQYCPKYKPTQIICGTGRTAIITGWLPAANVAKCLEPTQYASVGNLYSSTRGINFLVRNLLFNPHVSCLILLGITKEDENTQSVQCFQDFLENGVREGVGDLEDKWIINSPTPGYIDREVSIEALLQLRESIHWDRVSSTFLAYQQLMVYEAIPLKPWSTPQAFPMKEVKTHAFPGPRYGHRIEAKNIPQGWLKLLQRIRTTGTMRPTGYDGQLQELIDMVLVITDEGASIDEWQIPEYLPCDRDYLKTYIPGVIEDSPYQGGVKYKYGQRLRSLFGKDQVEQVIAKLIKEIDAASAVMSLWHVEDHEKGGSPCLNHIWVRVIDSELSLTAVFRSHDMFAGWPSNAYALRALQVHIAEQLTKRANIETRVAPLIIVSQSAHIYDDTWENADKVIDAEYLKLCRAEQKNCFDPAGNFEIFHDGKQVIVNLLDPVSGLQVARYKGHQCETLIDQICNQIPLTPRNAAYLGQHIERNLQELK